MAKNLFQKAGAVSGPSGGVRHPRSGPLATPTHSETGSNAITGSQRPAAALLAVAAAVVAALACASLLAPSQPGYDPWAWLTWGRELAALKLDTVDGPAFKPLPVAIAAALSALGDAAPAAWLVVARAGSLAAVVLAAHVAWRLVRQRVSDAAPAVVAATVAGGGVVLSSGWWWHAAVGNSEGLVLAFALGAFAAALGERHRPALALALLAGLLRPEAWPFLGLYGLWLWRRESALRGFLVAAAPLVLALWIVPEWLGSGDPLRSSERARVPNPGAPALAAQPALASLKLAAAIPLVPVALAAVLSVRQRLALLPAAAGVAWVLLVAAMAELGYSGEPRYALPGAALVAVSGGVGVGVLVARACRPAVAVALAVLIAAPFVVDRAGDVAGELRRASADAALWGSLDDAIAAAGGRERVLACGRLVTGRYRGTAVAWALRTPKRAVAFDPAVGGALLRSRIQPGAELRPLAPADVRVLGRSARWEIACAGISDLHDRS